LLYRDLPEKKIRGRISDYIWQIKKHLPGFPLLTTPDQIDLDKQSIWVDVKAFKAEIDKPSAPLSEKFIELYKGELLPELYDDWVLVERERWRSLYLRALRNLINNLLVEGDNEKAVSRMEYLLKEEPYDESVVRLLMQTSLKIGRRGAALAAYERFQLLSTEHLGMEPDVKTKRIYETAKAQAIVPRGVLFAENPFTSTPTDVDEILRQARFVLEQGDRNRLKQLLDTLPSELSYDQTLGKQLLDFDEKLAWGEIHEAEKILKECDVSSPTFRLRSARLASAKNEYVNAKNVVDSLLDDAHRLKQPELEAEALLMLGSINSDLGEIQESPGVIDRAISLSRKIDAHVIRVQAYLQKGKYWRLRGAEESAFDILKQAEQISRQYNLQPLLAESLNELGINSKYYGKYREALKYLSESLELARDLGLSKLEAACLLTLSGIFDFLGRHAETTEALKNASHIFENIQDTIGLAKCHYNLAYSLVSMRTENAKKAIEYAEKALLVFSDVRNLGWKASTHTALGYFHWLAKQPEQAIKNFSAAMKIHTELGEYLFIPEIHAYTGLAYLQKGDPHQGVAFTQFAVQEMARQNLSDVAAEIYFAHACVIQALGDDDEAKAYVKLSYETYLDFAKDIEDDDARAAYFERDPIIRQLMQMAYDYDIAPRPKKKFVTRKLPGIKNYKLELEITTDAGPADQALGAAHGIPALRRARIKRIMQEGSSHGSQPTIKEMAKLLHVSSRTIQRDLKVLEKE